MTIELIKVIFIYRKIKQKMSTVRPVQPEINLFQSPDICFSYTPMQNKYTNIAKRKELAEGQYHSPGKF